MKKYVYRPYSLIFPELFEREKARIAPHIHPSAKIEHIGSTAVPNLGGKGIIDIAIAIEKENLEEACKQLQDIGYEFRPHFSTPTKSFLINNLSDPEEELRRYHVHLTYQGSTEWNELIQFRDYLRTHPEEAKKYADMKKTAIEEANGDGKTYRKLKDPFIQNRLNESK